MQKKCVSIGVTLSLCVSVRVRQRVLGMCVCKLLLSVNVIVEGEEGVHVNQNIMSVNLRKVCVRVYDFKRCVSEGKTHKYLQYKVVPSLSHFWIHLNCLEWQTRTQMLDTEQISNLEPLMKAGLKQGRYSSINRQSNNPRPRQTGQC